MRICGLQKLTLLDYPGKTACTVFTGGCDFRCPFCHNAALVLRPAALPAIPEADFFAFLNTRKGLLDGVVVSGGEPTLQSGLPDFLRRVKALGFLTKLDTNGCRPALLRSLIEGGLCDYVAMDIKNAPEKYADTAGVPGLDIGPIRESAALLLEGRVDYEFRTTAVRELHSPAELRAIGAWLKGARAYYIQSFADSGDLVRPGGLSPCSPEELRALLRAVLPDIPAAALRGVD